MRRRYTDANTYGTPNDDNKALLSQRKKGSSRLQAHTTNTSKYVSDHICMHTHTKEMFRLLHGRLRNASSTSRAAFFFPTVNRARVRRLWNMHHKISTRATRALKTFHSASFSAHYSHLQFRIECLSYLEHAVSSRNVYTTLNMTDYDTLNYSGELSGARLLRHSARARSFVAHFNTRLKRVY
jgi:hypothetical protein